MSFEDNQPGGRFKKNIMDENIKRKVLKLCWITDTLKISN